MTGIITNPMAKVPMGNANTCWTASRTGRGPETTLRSPRRRRASSCIASNMRPACTSEWRMVTMMMNRVYRAMV